MNGRFAADYLNGRFESREIVEPTWWIVKRSARVRTPNFDLIRTATICGKPGVLLVEARAHHGELESCGKSFYQVSNRIAWGWRLASLGVPVTVLYLGFVQDRYWPRDRFESNEDWMQAARRYLVNVVPGDILDRRLQCSERGSLLISAGRAASNAAVTPQAGSVAVLVA